MAVVFRESWMRADGAHFDLPALVEPEGTPADGSGPGEGERCLVLDSRLGRGHRETALVLRALVAAARERVWITNAYFAPSIAAVRALCRAARRGVDVRLLLPGRTDHLFVKRAGQSFYAQLLRAGVRIYEWTRSPLHAKTAVVDDVWGVVGSANLDVRSFEINYEADLHVAGPRVGFLLTAAFLKDVRAAEEITLEAWERRGVWARLVEKFCALFRRFL